MKDLEYYTFYLFYYVYYSKRYKGNFNLIDFLSEYFEWCDKNADISKYKDNNQPMKKLLEKQLFYVKPRGGHKTNMMFFDESCNGFIRLYNGFVKSMFDRYRSEKKIYEDIFDGYIHYLKSQKPWEYNLSINYKPDDLKEVLN